MLTDRHRLEELFTSVSVDDEIADMIFGGQRLKSRYKLPKPWMAGDSVSRGMYSLGYIMRPAPLSGIGLVY